MRWKDDVTFTKTRNGCQLHLRSKMKPLLPEHEYLLEAMEKGTEDEEQLVELIKAKEKLCEAAARFTLAGFLMEYTDFIAADTTGYEIEG